MSCTLTDCYVQTTVGASGREKKDGEEQEKHIEENGEEEEVQVKGRGEEEDEDDEEAEWNDMELEHGEGEPESDTELEEEEEEEEDHQTCDVGQVDQSGPHSLQLGMHASIA